jgi:hypothetical protein
MKTILAGMMTALALAAWPASGALAQTATTAAPGHGKKIGLGTVKVQSRHVTPMHRGRPSTAAATGYHENVLSTVRFGSKEWWTIQGWQAGGSSPP